MKKANKRTTGKKKAGFFKRKPRPYFEMAGRVLLYGLAVSICWVFCLRFINPPVTWLMLERGFERKAGGKEWKLEKDWTDYNNLSDNLKKAAIAGEDARFMSHWGFDRQAIINAYKRNKDGRSLRGGSTISQQVAKNVFLWPGRSWIRKAFEAYFTVLMECLWTKQRILEVYLNVVEMGDGIYGAQAAAQFYYKKSAKTLTQRQAALLVAVLPNPKHWNPSKPTAYINRKASMIVRYMKYSKIP